MKTLPPSHEDPLNFNKPIIEGGTLEVFVHDVAEDAPAMLVSVRSLRPDVVRVTGNVAHMTGLKGRKPGRAPIVVRARDRDGDIHTDLFTMRVAAVDGVTLYDPCVGDDEEFPSLYRAGEKNVFVPWRRNSSNNEPLTGYGVFPVEVSPEGSAHIDKRSVDWGALRVDMPEEAMVFELRPSADVAGEALAIETVSPAAVDRVVMSEFRREPFTVVGKHSLLWAYPYVGERPLCSEENPTHTVRSLTPEICSVTTEFAGELIVVQGERFGVCRYEVGFTDYPNARATFTLPVAKPPEPGDEESGEHDLLPWWLAPLLALLTPVAASPWVFAWRKKRRIDVL